jgi:hypothetical protein
MAERTNILSNGGKGRTAQHAPSANSTHLRAAAFGELLRGDYRCLLCVENAMKTVLIMLIALSAWVTAVRVEADPARFPKRIVNGQAVDLTPLMDWWTKREGVRPLQAWVRVTGRIVGTNALGWTVEGMVEAPAEISDPPTNALAKTLVRIVLKNPPLADLVEFQRLTAQLQWMNQERARLSAEIENATNRQQELSETGGGGGKMFTRIANEELSQWQAAENDAKDQLDALDEQLKEANARLADNPDRSEYRLDCFALRCPEQLRGAPVYDHGGVFQ